MQDTSEEKRKPKPYECFTNQPKKLQPQRGNISGITWNIDGTEPLDYKRSYFFWVTVFKSYFSLNTTKEQLSITPVASCCNIPCCLSSSSTTSTGFNFLAVHSPLATGFAALYQAVNVTRICQIQSRADHGALSKRCTQFFTKKKKNLFPEDLSKIEICHAWPAMGQGLWLKIGVRNTITH